MSKKTALIIISIVVLLAAGGFLAFYFYTNQGQGNNIGGTEPRSNIFPETETGTSPTNTTGTGSGTTGTATAGQQGQTFALVKELSTRSSAGSVAMATSSGKTVVRFMEKGTGNIFEVRPDTVGETRISNTTVPKISEAIWNKDGTKVLARYAGDDGDSIKTYAGAVSKKADGLEMELVGSFLVDNIRFVAKNLDQTRVFYLLQHSGGSTGIISEFDGGKRVQIFDSPLSEWLIDWATPSFVALTTRPSASVPGYLFLLDTRTGKTTRAISGVKGLTATVNPNATRALYTESEKEQSGSVLKIYSFKTGSITETSVQTLPEKCVWSQKDLETAYCAVPEFMPTADYPDHWYQGFISFSDEIWKIDIATGTGERIASFKNSAGKVVDGINLTLSPDEQYLILTNKKDAHLWSVRVGEIL